ncbi:MAG: glycoside hydrolase family 95-like protein [Victivallales bacterium]
MTKPQTKKSNSQGRSCGDLHFASLAKTWEEGIPLGNGMIGALIWQKDRVLRFSLDRADLWDLRKIKEFENPEFRFSWMVEQVTGGNYKLMREKMGDVYNRNAAPTKLPCAALELPIPDVSDVESVLLRLNDAVCVIKWKTGIVLEAFVHATEHRGWFRITGLKADLKPRIIPPLYTLPDVSPDTGNSNSGPAGNELHRLGYPPPKLVEGKGSLIYQQECFGGFSYTVNVSWLDIKNNTMTGKWEIHPNRPFSLNADQMKTDKVPSLGAVSIDNDLKSHREWWSRFWRQSSIEIPDSMLESQWYREMYKFGCTSRQGAPPITLQAVWTADNGRLPPWKGDYHNDLNTQLSYWPCYSSNHLSEGLAFLDWLWWCKPVAERFTKMYFGTSGLNFPGVSTLAGEVLGCGGFQYSHSPTTSAWLAQHFYLHWRYSLDRNFLHDRAYPWICGVAMHLEELSVKDSLGQRKLPLSSSPEINEAREEAWFRTTTNYDLALIRWLFGAASELALELGDAEASARWRRIQSEWPELARLPMDGKLLVAPAIELKESHRHFSHLMAFHPLGLIDWDNGEQDRRTISSSLADIERLGTDLWCGYSFSWLGSMWARARNGEKAAEALKTFASCFCLPNSFHVNGDQSGTGKSKFTYRPFTLEGNFAFAEAVQEMLLQSHNGKVRIFPAIPYSWKNVSFTNLRAEGALLITARQTQGSVCQVKVVAEKGGKERMEDPFKGKSFTTEKESADNVEVRDGVIEFDAEEGGTIEFKKVRSSGGIACQ